LGQAQETRRRIGTTNREQSSLWCARVALILAVFAPLCQYAIGARFGPTGQQLTAGLPVPTLALLAAVVLLVVAGERGLPYLSWAQISLVCLASVGLLGLARQEWSTGVKELVQLGEIAVLAPFVYRASVRRLGWSFTIRTMACAFVALLLCLAVPQLAGLSARKGGMLLVLCCPFLLFALARLSSRGRRMAGALGSGVLLGLALSHGGLVLAAMVSLLVTALVCRRLGCMGLAGAAVAGLLLASAVTPFSSPWSALSPRWDAEHLRRGNIELLAAIRAPAVYPLGAGLGSYQAASNRLRQEVAEQPHPTDNKVPQDGNCQYAVLLVESGFAGVLGLVLFLGLALVGGPRSRVVGESPLAVFERRAALTGALAGAVACAAFGLLLSRGTGIWVGGLVGLAAMPAKGSRRFWRLAVCGGVVLALACGAYLGNEKSRDAGAPSWLNRQLASGQGPPASPLRIATLRDPLAGATDARVLQIEAETALGVSPPFAVATLGDASGGKGLVIPDHRRRDSGTAYFVVQIPQAGTYVLYARVYWEDGCSNSVRFVTADEGGVTLSSGTYGKWHTLEGSQPFNLRQGELRVGLQNLEDGIRIDYWGLRPQ